MDFLARIEFPPVFTSSNSSVTGIEINFYDLCVSLTISILK